MFLKLTNISTSEKELVNMNFVVRISANDEKDHSQGTTLYDKYNNYIITVKETLDSVEKSLNKK